MDNHAGNIPEQSNIPPMVLIQWPQQVYLPFNPHVPGRFSILPNGMYYCAPQWIQMHPVYPGIPVMRLTPSSQMRGQQIENAQSVNEQSRNNNVPRYNMNPVDNSIRIGAATDPQQVGFNWQGYKLIVLQNNNQAVPWESLNPAINELQLVASSSQANIQEIEVSPINEGTSTERRQETDILVNSSQDLQTSTEKQIQDQIQNNNHQVHTAINVPQNWNASMLVPDKTKINIPSNQDSPILVNFENIALEAKQPEDLGNVTKHLNNSMFKPDEQRPQSSNKSPVSVPQNWNSSMLIPNETTNNITLNQDAPIMVPIKQSALEAKQTHESSDLNKHQNNPMLKLDETSRQNNKMPPVSIPQNWNSSMIIPNETTNNIPLYQDAPIMESFERSSLEVKQPYKSLNSIKHQNNPMLKLDEQGPQNTNISEVHLINEVHENSFHANSNALQIMETTSPNEIKNSDSIVLPENSSISSTIEEVLAGNVKMFNKMAEDFALSVEQQSIDKLLKRKVSTFCGNFFQGDITSQLVKKPRNMTIGKGTASTSVFLPTTELIPSANKSTENATDIENNNSFSLPVPAEIYFPPINSPNAFDFSAYKEFLESQEYENMLQLEQSKEEKKTLIALDEGEQKLKRLKQERPFYFQLVTFANFNSQMKMKKHLTKFEYKKMLYKNILKSKETYEKIWNEQIKNLMVDDIERKRSKDNAENKNYALKVKPKCCKQLFLS